MSIGTRIKNAVHEVHVKIKIIWEKFESFSYKAGIKFTFQSIKRSRTRNVIIYIGYPVLLKIKGKNSLCLIKYHTMKIYGEAEIYLHFFFNLDSRRKCAITFTLGKDPPVRIQWEAGQATQSRHASLPKRTGRKRG
jgi:hypothetical protein